MAVTPSQWPSSVCKAAPVAGFHSLTVLSSDTDASFLPSCKNAMALTQFLLITFDSDLEFRRSAGYLFAVFHVFDARSGEDADGSIAAHVYFVRGCSSCWSNRVLQLAELKEVVVE
jgi:hypothetical protein